MTEPDAVFLFQDNLQSSTGSYALVPGSGFSVSYSTPESSFAVPSKLLAVSMNGTGGSLSCTGVQYASLEDFSVEYWFRYFEKRKPSVRTSYSIKVLGLNNWNVSAGYDQRTYMNLYGPDTYGTSVDLVNINLNEWHHLVINYSIDMTAKTHSATIFIDGIRMGTTQATKNYSLKPQGFNFFAAPYYSLEADLMYMRLYLQKHLTESEINYHYLLETKQIQPPKPTVLSDELSMRFIRQRRNRLL